MTFTEIETDVSKLATRLDDDVVTSSDRSFLLDEIQPKAPLIICFGFYFYNTPNQFDFYRRVKKLEGINGSRVNILLIRDKSNSWYQRGIEGLGATSLMSQTV